MISLSTPLSDPNVITFYNTEGVRDQLEAPEIQERYSSIMQMFPGMAASYLPTHSIHIVPQPHFAALSGSISQLSQLESLADLRTNLGHSPLHYALAYKQKEAIRYLIDQCDLSHITPQGNTYLHYAALTGDPEIIDLFINRNIDPTIRNKDNLSAAHLWAFVSNDLDYLQKLMPENTQEAKESFDFTPLQLMALNALHANNTILSDSEWKLFLNNLTDLGIVSLSYICQTLRIRNFASTLFEMAHTGMMIKKVQTIHTLAPNLLKRELNPDQAFYLYLKQWTPVASPPLTLACFSGLSTAAVAWSTLTQFPKLMQISWPSALTTSGVRLTNFAFGVFDTYLATNYPRYKGYYCYTDAVKKLNGLSQEELLNELSSNPVKQCKQAYPELNMNPKVDPLSKETEKIIDQTAQEINCGPECLIASTHLNSLRDMLKLNS